LQTEYNAALALGAKEELPKEAQKPPEATETATTEAQKPEGIPTPQLKEEAPVESVKEVIPEAKEETIPAKAPDLTQEALKYKTAEEFVESKSVRSGLTTEDIELKPTETKKHIWCGK